MNDLQLPGLRSFLGSLRAQLFLWAALPVALVLIALAFTGVYSHQSAMRRFVAERDLRLARLQAVLIQDAILHGTILSDGTGMEYYLRIAQPAEGVRSYVVDARGTVVRSLGELQPGEDLGQHPGVRWALGRTEGASEVPMPGDSPLIISAVRIETMDWWVILEEPVDEVLGTVLRLSSVIPVVALAAGLIAALSPSMWGSELSCDRCRVFLKRQHGWAGVTSLPLKVLWVASRRSCNSRAPCGRWALGSRATREGWRTTWQP